MKRIILASLLFATPALAQQASQAANQPTTAEQLQATQIELQRERAAHDGDLAYAVKLSAQNEALQKQVAELTKELKASQKPADKAPAPKPVAK